MLPLFLSTGRSSGEEMQKLEMRPSNASHLVLSGEGRLAGARTLLCVGSYDERAYAVGGYFRY